MASEGSHYLGRDAQPEHIRCHRICRPTTSVLPCMNSAVSDLRHPAPGPLGNGGSLDRQACPNQQPRSHASPFRNCHGTKPTMSLVLYSDSESDQDDTLAAQSVSSVTRPNVKRKCDDTARSELPPLPASFHDLYSTNARIGTSDNASLHGGRKRAVPHIDGNWPSHVHLECKASLFRSIHHEWLARLT
jgi:hypothetical protein